jgi:hypothetical protein
MELPPDCSWTHQGQPGPPPRWFWVEDLSPLTRVSSSTLTYIVPFQTSQTGGGPFRRLGPGATWSGYPLSGEALKFEGPEVLGRS